MSESFLGKGKKGKKTQKSFLSFSLILNKGKKTSKWLVSNSELKTSIGEVKWFGRWRKYCFFPYNHTVYDGKCLIEIQKFLEMKTAEHKAENKKAKKDGKAKETQSVAPAQSGLQSQTSNNHGPE